MADVKITAPNPEFIGVRAGIGFTDGVATTEVDPTDRHAKALLEWFESHGYDVQGPDDGWNVSASGPPGDNATRAAWAAYAQWRGVYVGDKSRDELRDAVADLDNQTA